MGEGPSGTSSRALRKTLFSSDRGNDDDNDDDDDDAGCGSARHPSRRSCVWGSARRRRRRSSTMVSGRAAREDADARGGGDETAAAPEIVSLVTNEREAGEMWRVDRFKEFRFRVRCAGLESDPEFVEALGRMAALTRELSEMSAAQARDASEAPWWRDREYDEARAEEANDDGMRKIGEQRYEEAFEAFTEAIRLEPRRAVYHANRAAAGLKLQRYRVAADDAACAIERDSNYLKALIRGGTANLRLRCADKALKMFDAALAVAPEDERALRGKREAAQALAAAEAEAERQRDAALHGARTALPRHDIDLEVAAESLLSAEAALCANPNLEGAKANVAEALVCCQRYEAAIERCKTLLEDSLDRKYIVAETRWRMADVDGALAEISSASCRDSYDELACKKCVDLGARLLRLKDLMARAEREMEDEQFTTAIRCFDKVLETPEGKMMTRLRGKILRDRASCQLKRHEYDSRDDPIASENLASALRDLNECLKIDGNDHEAHVTRASVRACRGDHHGAFTDLRAAQTVAPTLPGIDDMVRVSAVRALRRSSGEGASTNASFTEESTARGGKFHDILGVSPDASARAVTSAYRKLAAVWHPDKWTRADPADAQNAEERFTSIQRAHATLSDAKQRKMYDLDPARFEA